MFKKLIFVSIFVFVSLNVLGKECEIKRGAIDLGSGSTKVSVAKVNVCKNQIIEKLHEEEIALKFKDNLRSNQNQFSKEFVKEAKSKLKSFLEPIWRKYSIEKKNVFTVATAAFRQAENSKEVIESLEKELGLKLNVIEGKVEADIGFWGAVIETGLSPEDIVVWDIGGGSMQITTNVSGKSQYYLGEMASVSFKAKVLEKQNDSKKDSPNPIGKENVANFMGIAEEVALSEVPASVKEALRSKAVIGIGGVLYYSVSGQLKNKQVDLEKLLKLANERAVLTDKEVGGKYAATDVSNLILVGGFMKALGVKTLKAVKVNLTNALLVYPDRFL